MRRTYLLRETRQIRWLVGILVVSVLGISQALASGVGGSGVLALAMGLPAAGPMDNASVGALVSSLQLTPEQQVRLLGIASRHQGNLNDPRFLSEVESILSPRQREQARDLLRQHAPRPSAPKPVPSSLEVPRARGVFSAAFISGVKDRFGRTLGGTEIVGLAAHQGKLYAAASVWKDNANRAPRRGAQVLVLERVGGNWKLDMEFDPSIRSIAAIESFSRPGASSARVGVEDEAWLFVAPLGPRTKANTILYRKGHEPWTTVELVKHPPLQARAFGFHEDQQTREAIVLVACQPGGIFRGVFDGEGTIAWEGQPEFGGFSANPTSFARCNNALHVAIGAQVYRREDGSSPSWKRVFVAPRGGRGDLRGLTAIPSPTGTGQVLLATQDGCGRVLRIDPTDAYRPVVETTVAALLGKEWGARPQFVVAGRHGMLPMLHPQSANSVHLFGVEARVGGRARPTLNGWERGGWLVIRRSAEDYELKEIIDPALEEMPALVSTRAMAVSPFTNLLDPIIYCGGYNADSGPAHDTGWIAQASLGALMPDD